MSKPVAYFTILHGLRGCYMPDSNSPYAISTRRELASIIREELAFHDAPKSRFADFEVSRLWAHMKRYGASSLHRVAPTVPGFALELCGMTEAEYAEATQDGEE